MPPLSPITLKTPTIKIYHKRPYPGISPLRPELSQTGKTVLIAGGSTGIGFAIARAFVQAKASRVIITGRRESVVKESAAKLTAEADATTATVIGVAVDINNLDETSKLFASLKNDNIFVDVLVLNAATTGDVTPILQAGLKPTWKAFEINVRTILDLTEHFYKQEGKHQKYLINVSTSAIHNFHTDATVVPAYGLTKNAGTLLLQQIAKDTDAKEMQIISFHPGAVLTEMAIANGVPKDLYDWDDVELPGQFAVWLASEESKFAHGRVLAAHWDVDELKGETRKEIDKAPAFLQIGVLGL
jgi:NAD(P)-dependent dehydrogenase (short-subunit alcohol dehydrogenase family)